MSKPDNNPVTHQHSERPLGQSGNKSRKNLVIVVSVAAVVVIALVAVIIVLLNREPMQKEIVVVEQKQSGKGTVITPENLEQVQESDDNQVQDSYYTVNMNNKWTFDTAQTPSRNAFVRNVENNSRTVFFEVSLADTNEIVYTSPYIPVGSVLRDFALDTELEAGDHSAVVTYYLVDDDYNVLTNVSVTVTLIVRA